MSVATVNAQVEMIVGIRRSPSLQTSNHFTLAASVGHIAAEYKRLRFGRLGTTNGTYEALFVGGFDDSFTKSSAIYRERSAVKPLLRSDLPISMDKA